MVQQVAQGWGAAMESFLKKQTPEKRVVLEEAYRQGQSRAIRAKELAKSRCIRCIGTGGFGPYELANVGWVFTEYCDCAAGDEQKIYDKIKAEASGSEGVKTLAWHVSGVPAILYGATLEKSPHKLIAQKMRFRGRDSFLQDADWYEDKAKWQRSWYIFGGFGVGKSWLAVGYMREWLWKSGMGDARFTTTPNLLAEIRATYGPPREGKREEADVVYDYCAVDLLVLDDLGSERMTENTMDVFTRIIGNRHDSMRTTVFTSNYSLDELEPRLSPRLTWRILEMCSKEHVVEIQGDNLRLEA